MTGKMTQNSFGLLGSMISALVFGAVLGTGCGTSDSREKEPKGTKDVHSKKREQGRTGGQSQEPRRVHLDDKQREEFGIQLATAGPQTLSLNLELTGEVRLDPNRVAHLVPIVGGVARHVFKQLGDRVKRGELMATLDSRDLAQLSADYLAAQAERALASSEYQREKKLYGRGVTSEKEFLRARVNLSRATVSLQSARRKLLALGLSKRDVRKTASKSASRLSRLELRSPFSGVVVEKHITYGEYLKANSRAFTIADLSKVWVVLKVYQKDLGLVRVGQSVRIEAAYGRLKAEGRISYVSPIVNRSTRTASARVVLDNSAGGWLPGLFVNAKVVVERLQAPVAVPRSAIQRQDGKDCVFVRRVDGFECRRISLGRGNSRFVSVTGGLKPGDVYVSKGGFTLKAQLNVSSFGDHDH